MFQNKHKFFLFLAIFLVFLSGCGSNQNKTQSGIMGNPTPEDFLKDKNADIFLMDNIVFSKDDRGKESNYTLGKEVGEITKHTENADEFEDWTANKLPIGTKIYKTDKSIYYVAVVDGKEIPYQKMVEG